MDWINTINSTLTTFGTLGAGLIAIWAGRGAWAAYREQAEQVALLKEQRTGERQLRGPRFVVSELTRPGYDLLAIPCSHEDHIQASAKDILSLDLYGRRPANPTEPSNSGVRHLLIAQVRRDVEITHWSFELLEPVALRGRIFLSLGDGWILPKASTGSGAYRSRNLWLLTYPSNLENRGYRIEFRFSYETSTGWTDSQVYETYMDDIYLHRLDPPGVE